MDAGGFSVTLQADTTPGTSDHGLLTVDTGATVITKNMTLRHGRGTMAAAAVQSDGALTLEDCTVTDNHAPLSYDYPGIANTGTLTLVRSVISDHAYGRAAVMNIGPAAVLTVRDSTFRDNGIAGIVNSDGASVSLSGCTFVGNHTSGYGSCVQMWTGGGTLTADNCTFSGNSTPNTYGGAAVYLANSGDPAAVLTNCTISGNMAPGTYGKSAIAMYSGSVTVTNSIVAGTCHSAVTGTYSYFDPAKPGTGNLSPADGDPGVGMPADNGGPTLTCALSPESVCIDAGTGVALSEDQRGYPRDRGNGTDMGAFEVQADPVQDAEPPTVPGNLTAEGIAGYQVRLSWDASSDNVAVSGYRIFRDDTFVAEITGTSYDDTGLTPLTEYSYTVSACDAAENCSEESGPVSVSVPGDTPDVITVIPDDLTADFRDSEWAGAHGQGTYTVGSVTAAAGDAVGNPLDLWQDGTDGLGILNGGWEADEIEADEVLSISFDGGAELTGVWITDLFSGETGHVRLLDEEGNLLDTHVFDGSASDPGNGEQHVPFDPDGPAVFSASFMTELPKEGNEFSVAGFTTASANTPPSVAVTEPDGEDDIADHTFIIRWTDNDPDDDAQISLYNEAGGKKIPIMHSLSEDADGTDGEYEWDVSGVPPGEYYVYAVITDGANPPVTAYSPGAVTVTAVTVSDTESPTVPENLTAAGAPVITGHRIGLSWDASSDNVGVAHYEIFRDGSSLGTVTGTAYTDDIPGAAVQTAFTYAVTACDAAGNCSEESLPASVTVTPANIAPSLAVTEPDGEDDIADHTFIIRWTDDDPDDDAQISLYYDTDNAGADGILITDGLSEDDDGPGDEYVWQIPADLPRGEYYVYAVISDGTDASATAYSSGTVTFVKDDPLPEIIDFSAHPQTIIAGGVSTLSWKVINAESVRIDSEVDSDFDTIGTATVSPTETITYTLTATGTGGAATADTVVNVSEFGTLIEITSGISTMNIPVGMPRSISFIVRFETDSTDTYTIDFSQASSGNGISFNTGYPSGWSYYATKSWFVNETLIGDIVGTYEFTTTVTIKETGQTSQVTTIINVTDGEEYPVLKPLGSCPDAISVSESADVLFTTMQSKSATEPDEVVVEEVDESENVISILGQLNDDGSDGDLQADDLVYSATFDGITSDTEGKIFYRAKAVFPGIAEPVYSDIHTLVVTHFPTDIRMPDMSKIVTDPDTGQEILSNEIIVSFLDGTDPDTIESVVDSAGCSVVGTILGIGFYQIEIPEKSDAAGVYAVIDDLLDNPEVETAEPAGIESAAALFSPNDPSYASQWGLKKIRADEAWTVARGNTPVAVLDTGVDYTHPDLDDKVIRGRNYWGWIWDWWDPKDDDLKHGHGTAVAGIVAAECDNGTGICGVSWKSKILAVKVLAANGKTSFCVTAKGIKYAADRGAKIINMSFGSYQRSSVVEEAVDYAYSKGILLVASAGNNRSFAAHYPSGFSNVLSVGATDIFDFRCSESNYGNWVDIAAPGDAVYTTAPTGLNGGYISLSGTSMAAPMVSGTAAVVWSEHPEWEAVQVRERLEKTAKPLGTASQLGKGRIDLFEAVFNGSFEIGDLSEWKKAGIANCYPHLGSIRPVSRNGHQKGMAYVSTASPFRSISTLSRSFTIQPNVTSVDFFFDYIFITEEYPEYVGTEYNDRLNISVEMPDGTFKILAAESVNSSSLFTPNDQIPDFPDGDTTFGSTGLVMKMVSIPVTEGICTFKIFLKDEGDSMFNSAVLIDNIRFKP